MKKIAKWAVCLSFLAFPLTSSGVSVEELLKQIEALQAQLRNLQAQIGTNPETSTTFNTDLYIGINNSSEVLKLQKFLASQGYFTGEATGNFFSLTEAAVKKLQAARGLPATGYFGPATRAQLNSTGQTSHELISNSEKYVTDAIVAPNTVYGRIFVTPGPIEVKVGAKQLVTATYQPYSDDCDTDPCATGALVPRPMPVVWHTSESDIISLIPVTHECWEGNCNVKAPINSQVEVLGLKPGKAQLYATYKTASNMTVVGTQVAYVAESGISNLPAGTITLGIPESGNAGDSISVSWVNSTGQTTAQDWIALVPRGQSWSSIYPWFYTKGAIKGSGTLKLPDGAGSYDVVYYSNNVLTEMERVGPITALVKVALPILPPEQYINARQNDANYKVFDITWSVASPNPKDWVALVPRYSIWSPAYPWAYTNGAAQGSVSLMFDVPGVTAVEAVYYLNNESIEFRRSVPVSTNDFAYSGSTAYEQMALTLLRAQAILNSLK